MNLLKRSILLLVAALALPLSSAFATAGDHDSQNILATGLKYTSTGTTEAHTLATITTHNITSSNSYLIIATIQFDVPLGNGVIVELQNGGTAIADTVQNVAGAGYITLVTTVESIANGTAITAVLIFPNAGMPGAVPRCKLAVHGILGVTQ